MYFSTYRLEIDLALDFVLVVLSRTDVVMRLPYMRCATVMLKVYGCAKERGKSISPYSPYLFVARIREGTDWLKREDGADLMSVSIEL